MKTQNYGHIVNISSEVASLTTMSSSDAPFTAEEGAETAVYLATLLEGGAQGKFFAEMRKFGGPIAVS
jgi:hypothetical protein